MGLRSRCYHASQLQNSMKCCPGYTELRLVTCSDHTSTAIDKTIYEFFTGKKSKE